MLSRRKGCQFLTLLTVLYPQSDRFVLLDLHFLTFHLEFMSHTTQKKNRMNKYSTVSYRNILAVYCFVSKGIWFACFRERVLFIGTRFSNLMKRPPRGQTLEEDEINPSSQIVFYSSSKQDFTVSYRDIGSILFVPKGTNYSHVFPWWNRLLGKEKKLHVNIFLSSNKK